eukprot:TRINITY_DN29874_c0_g1_i1.p1 TRINITY_DN29874_c0_g1~~TRINITY_DN29874_c0_g1_i1.p1  ORF type:complete len:281 (+),score=88.37 TRINITY_DN29874_c0_g1_i1:67-909(+)
MLGPPRSQNTQSRQRDTSKMLLNVTTMKCEHGVDPKQLSSFQVRHRYAMYPGTTRSQVNARKEKQVLATPAPGLAGEVPSSFDKARQKSRSKCNTFGSRVGTAWLKMSDAPGVGLYSPRDSYHIKGGALHHLQNRSLKAKDDAGKDTGRRIFHDPNTPGPAAYTPEPQNLERSSSVHMASHLGRDYISGTSHPSGCFIKKELVTKAGPADYAPESSFTVKSFNANAMAQAREKSGCYTSPARTPLRRSCSQGTPKRLFSTPTASSLARVESREAEAFVLR